jgi:hypothetical protein
VLDNEHLHDTRHLRHLIYLSMANDGVDLAEAQRIADKASAANKRLHISGLLLYSSRHFVQVLEGPQDVVNRLYHRISQDRRHTRVELMAYYPVVRRQYARWNMGLALFDELDWSGHVTPLDDPDSRHEAAQHFERHPARITSPYELSADRLQFMLASAATRLDYAELHLG